jgi:hypothetical protein
MLISANVNEIYQNIRKKSSPNSILFSSMRTYIQMPGYWPEGSSGFHPIGINGGPSRSRVAERDRQTGCGRKQWEVVS